MPTSFNGLKSTASARSAPEKLITKRLADLRWKLPQIVPAAANEQNGLRFHSSNYINNLSKSSNSLQVEIYGNGGDAAMRYLSVCSGHRGCIGCMATSRLAPCPCSQRSSLFVHGCCTHATAQRGLFTCRVRMTRHQKRSEASAPRPSATSLRCPPMAQSSMPEDFTHIGAEDVGASTFWPEEHLARLSSVAGKRAGLDDPAWQTSPSSLLDLLIGSGPYGWCGRTSPGVLSIDGGRTFGAFLHMLVPVRVWDRLPSSGR